MPTKSQLQQLSQQAGFIFQGTVKQRGTATMAQVPANNSTLIVSVDQIIKAPDLLQSFAGQNITVQLGSGQRAQTGKQYVFYTNGWIYGSSIAVVALGVTPATEAVTRTSMAAATAAPALAMGARAADAQLVVAGQVVEVRPAERPQGAPITEHDPVWHEAVVQVDTVHKGAMPAGAANQVVVRFARSNDVRWYQAPKFDVGQEGVWMLGSARAAAAGVALAEAAPGTYTVTDPADYVPKEQADKVRSALK